MLLLLHLQYLCDLRPVHWGFAGMGHHQSFIRTPEKYKSFCQLLVVIPAIAAILGLPSILLLSFIHNIECYIFKGHIT